VTNAAHEPTEVIDDKIAKFFFDPNVYIAYGPLSTLYLVRQEVQRCLIDHLLPEEDVLRHKERRCLFASTMVVFAGIDLLAKCAVAGNDRVVKFLQTYGQMNGRRLAREEAEAIVAFRNALMHSFGLHHKDEDGRIVPLIIYWDPERRDAVERRGDGWMLSIDGLLEMFYGSIRRYKRALSADTEGSLRRQFAEAFDRYGMITVAQGPVRKD